MIISELNINIKTKFIVGDKILERNSNNTYNDNIIENINLQMIYI